MSIPIETPTATRPHPGKSALVRDNLQAPYPSAEDFPTPDAVLPEEPARQRRAHRDQE